MTLPSCAATPLRIAAGAAAIQQPVDDTLFHADPKGWTITADLTGQPLDSGKILFALSSDAGQAWLSVAVSQERSLLAFSLKTDYKNDPLIVALPIAMLEKVQQRKLLLRYRKNSLDLYLDGVLVDQEWPLGEIITGQHPQLAMQANHPALVIWPESVSNAHIESENGGARKIAALSDTILGPQPEFVQYSRPRGWNTNAGDAMPYFRNGLFHLYYLLDRRQHHSKWGLGAHQWAHISSPDLIHWTHYPIALGIDSDWEGSICTGSVFFNGGKYYAFYATRMRDRSEHLAMAVGDDAIHFKKIVPSQFAEPQPPYVHGPNRDPFVFQADGKFHMIVTAAIPSANGKTEGALEHLTSTDLKQWTVEPELFLRSGTEEQPECSDLFQWKGWYYLLYSLSGTTHYKIAKSPLGPWTRPENDILDGPEAIVMKAAAFRDNRFLSVGFLQHDNRYGGDLVFRELVQQPDGSLGSKFPKEMMRPATSASVHLDDLSASPNHASQSVPLTGNTQFDATLQLGAQGKASLVLAYSDATKEQLVLDSASRTVTWTDSEGKPEHAVLKNVAGLGASVSLTLILHGTIADVQLNGSRTLVHRLAAVPKTLHLEAAQGKVSMVQIAEAAIR
ncbi:MAG TPA: family 43 glycosylhydrolase [Acidobacteriaceae bacterium]|nr:family 43 glycosylhydrolase [Acidobacteriaceae bacterium]